MQVCMFLLMGKKGKTEMVLWSAIYQNTGVLINDGLEPSCPGKKKCNFEQLNWGFDVSLLLFQFCHARFCHSVLKVLHVEFILLKPLIFCSLMIFSENLSFRWCLLCCIGILCWLKFQFFALDLGLRLIILVPARKFNLGYY